MATCAGRLWPLEHPAGLRNLVWASTAKSGPERRWVQKSLASREPEISVFWLVAKKRPDAAEALFGRSAACLLVVVVTPVTHPW